MSIKSVIYSGPVVRRALRVHVFFRILNLIFGFSFQLAVVKTLEPTEYARYAIFLAALVLAQNILVFGVGRAIQRFVPYFTLRGEFNLLAQVASRFALIRLISIVIFILAAVFGAQVFTVSISIDMGRTTFVAFTMWVIASILQTDAEALAKSWTSHSEAALVATLEVLTRLVAFLLLIAFLFSPSAELIVFISGATSSAAVGYLCFRLWQRCKLIQRSTSPIGVEDSQGGAPDVSRAISFALLVHASTLSWLFSSPAAIRLVATSGIGVIPFASFSFSQGLLLSLQRGLPGQLILPGLEPLVMAELAGDARRERIFAALSLTLKLELICLLVLSIITTIAGSEILRLLARPEYAPYYLVLPVITIIMAMQSIYQAFEILGAMFFRQKSFALLWPLSIISLFAIYMTVPKWGLVSVLVWPLIEGTIRIVILGLIFRSDGALRVFDLRRLTILLLGAGATIILGLALQDYFVVSGVAEIPLAIFCSAVFCMLLPILRPMHSLEQKLITDLFPKKAAFGRIGSWLTRL